MFFKKDKTLLGSKIKPVMKLINGLSREEFDQLLMGMQLIFDGVQEFKGERPMNIEDDIDELEMVLTKETKAKKPKKKQ